MDKQKALVLCGIFALSNMGMPLPKAREVHRAIRAKISSPRNSAEWFCISYMESDEYEEAFAAEAEHWFEYLMETPDERIREVHKDISRLYDEAERMLG